MKYVFIKTSQANRYSKDMEWFVKKQESIKATKDSWLLREMIARVMMGPCTSGEREKPQ